MMVNKKDKQIQSLSYSYGEVGLGFDIDTHGPFGDNYACAHAYKKTEKILIALYLVTNSVPEKESARNIVRDKAILILSDILQLRSGFKSTGPNKVGNVIASIYEVISLLDVLHVSGFVSDMNLMVLKSELSDLIIFLRDATDTETSEKVMFNDEHFNTGDIKDTSSIKDIKRTSFNIKDINKGVRGGRSVSTPASTARKHNERSATILKLVKDKKNVSVKDISVVITDCSEKTIQRELITLINENVLKKEGERRWSTYSLT